MRKLVFLSIFIMFGFSVTELHAAAKEKASAKNFDPKLVASLQKLLDPNRFYPDLSGIFNSSSLNAASQFLYIPRFEGGKPISTPGVQNKLTFDLAYQ